MLHRIEKLYGMSIGASDGEVGKIIDAYFDDARWAVRYLVVDAGAWLELRQVLISPIAIRQIDWDGKIVYVDLSREQVRDSPPITADRPVSRQNELDVLRYYGYPEYWVGSMLWGISAYPVLPPARHLRPGEVDTEAALPAEPAGDPHLRSTREVAGYHIETSDGAIGHVVDFLLEERTWALRYLEIDTRNWWPGKHVLMPTPWVREVRWPDRVAGVDVTRSAIETAPRYDPSVRFTRHEEGRLHQHYARSGYWSDAT